MIIPAGALEFRLLGLFRTMEVEGILGWPALHRMRVAIDYKNRQTTIDRPVPRADSERNLFYSYRPIVRLITQEGVALNMLLDTGAQETSLFQNALRKIDVKDVGQLRVTPLRSVV